MDLEPCRLARPPIARKAASLILLFPKSSDSRLVQAAKSPTTRHQFVAGGLNAQPSPWKSNRPLPISLKAATASRSLPALVFIRRFHSL